MEVVDFDSTITIFLKIINFLSPGYPQESRNLGLVMVPGPHIKKISIKTQSEDNII